MKKSEKKFNVDIPQKSFLELCQENFLDKILFTIDIGKEAPQSFTGKTITEKSIGLSQILQEKAEPQQRVLILLPQGLEYIYSLLACFHANVIAVPIPLNEFYQPELVFAKVKAIGNDAQSTVIITNTSGKEILNQNESLKALNIIDLSTIDSKSQKVSVLPRINTPDDIAIILYTSGSTSEPKGVLISHYNLKVRAWISALQWEIDAESCVVSWLPQFHSFAQDLNIFAPLLVGARSVILAPQDFVKNPATWFTAINKYKATHTGAPNFAFDYCTSMIDIRSLESVSLQSLRVVLTGGEAVRKETCDAFSKKFKSIGFPQNCICPIYGLSEIGTVTTKKTMQPIKELSLDYQSLEQRKILISDKNTKSKLICSCGKINAYEKIAIVNPETLTPCLQNEIGEIWVISPALGGGYYGRSEETKKVFVGSINQSSKGRYLRTGDLGFIYENELFIIGREKEVIVINGKNYHPVDLEWTIKEKIPSLTLPVAVFSTEIDMQDRVIIVQEVSDIISKSECERLVVDIRSAISYTYQIDAFLIALVKEGSIPRTASGKIQRKQCLAAYKNSRLEILFKSSQQTSTAVTEQMGVDGQKVKNNNDEVLVNRNQEFIEIIRSKILMPVLKITGKQLENVESFSELGLNSIQYIQIAKKIGEVFSIEFNPVLLYKHQRISELVSFFASQDLLQSQSTIKPSEEENKTTVMAGQVSDLDIAIIGIGFHFPGEAFDAATFWENLISEKDCISQITERQSILEDLRNSVGDSDESFPQWGGFTKDVYAFDAPFFNISTLEAESMDPQQRKMLELTWSVIEDAGYNPRSFSGNNVGLFIGVHGNDYSEIIARQSGVQKTYGAFLDSGLHLCMIANRVSRWFDFHGPSEIVNTACSSSLVAVHNAVESIKRGHCSVAIAGGINILLSSRVYFAAQKGGMLAVDGRCKTFDKSANGFVRSEGYGAVFLKPAKQAIEDGDNIYGIIKATAVNHDGHSNSLRAPNVIAQKDLLKTAYIKSGIPVSTISYIETHGTGTALGDPIEVQALKETFVELGATTDKPFCGLGSVKTNIGHLESAAGVAGLIKILLSFKYKTIPSLLHFNTLNPFIELDNSPFYVANTTHDWKRLLDENGIEVPLRAGISSFGFGGSNAHIVVEEPQSTNQVSINKEYPVVILLSAKNEDQLKIYVRQLLASIENQKYTDNDLPAIAFTLQTGREAMEARLGIITSSIHELINKLRCYIDVKDNVNGIYAGRIGNSKDSFEVLKIDEDMASTIEAWLTKRKYSQLLNLWVKGMAIDWSYIYRGRRLNRISLPTYPFTKNRYIISKETQSNIFKTVSEKLHPLVHVNESNFSEQRFRSRFSGDEFFLKDHKVKLDGFTEEMVLPGVAYLEMARFAINKSMGEELDISSIELRNIVWIKPFLPKNTQELFISLVPSESEENQIDFEIVSQINNEINIHCQGQAVLLSNSQSKSIDLAEVKSQLSKESLDSSSIYPLFNKMGIVYGPAHMCIRSVYKGNNKLLAELWLPSGIENTLNDFIIHPSIVDSAWQSTLCLDVNSLNENKPLLPFALESVRVFSPCTAEMYALIGTSDCFSTNDSVIKFDIEMYDKSGKKCIEMHGLSTRPLQVDFKDKIKSNGNAELSKDHTSLLPIWNPYFFKMNESNTSLLTKTTVLIGGTTAQYEWVKQSIPQCEQIGISYDMSINCIAELLKGKNNSNILWIAPNLDIYKQDNETQPDFIEAQKNGVLAVYKITKALLQSGFADKELEWTLLTSKAQKVKKNDSVCPSDASIFGFIGSVAKEYDNWSFRLLDIESLDSISALECWNTPISKEGNGFACRNGEWFIQELVKVDSTNSNLPIYRQKGVYIVIGGAGGVGEVWSRYMIEKYNANIVWIGRRKPDDVINSKIEALSKIGNAPYYVTADATSLVELENAYGTIRKIFPNVNGIVNAAIVLKDQSIASMDEQKFREGLSSKVDTSVNIDKVFGKMDLDFILFFSSMISFSKNPGQSNYSSGCTFQDSFAAYLAQKHLFAVKVINWGYWGSIGIVADQFYSKRMEQLGIAPITPLEGMLILQKLMSSPLDQLLVYKEQNHESITQFRVTKSLLNYSMLIDTSMNEIKSSTDKSIKKADVGYLDAGRFPERAEILSTAILFATLNSTGVITQSGKRKYQIAYDAVGDTYIRRWIASSIDYLRYKGMFDEKGMSYKKPEDLDSLWKKWNIEKTAWLENPSCKSHISLVEICLKSLPAILNGKQRATDVLFPNSSVSLIEGIYKDNLIADYYNEILGKTFKSFVKQRMQNEKNATVRVLEIGAGTGGTTAKLLPVLKELSSAIAEYCYTDLSKAFLYHAEEHFKPQFPALTTAIFDVSKSAFDQSIPKNNYDLILATNVLHATPNIRETLRNAKALLKNQGLILINEIVEWSLFTHLTFGLLEGWWLHEDSALRIPGSPALAPKKWQEILSEEGFENVYFPADHALQYGQQVIAALSNGIVYRDISTVSNMPIEPTNRETENKIEPAVYQNENSSSDGTLHEKSIAYFQKLIAETIRMKPEEIRLEQSFSEYGLDSILIVQLTNKLRKIFPDVVSTLFFEVHNLKGLVNHFLENKSELLKIAVSEVNKTISTSLLTKNIENNQEQKIHVEDKPIKVPVKNVRKKVFGIIDSRHEVSTFDVAVVGLSGRYPFSNDLNEFWDNLINGRNCITEVPKDRWDWEAYFDPEKGKPGKIYTQYGGFLKEIDKFDPLFFKISPKEAKRMDPQERMFLEECYHAIEDAGYTPETLGELEKIGVFVGVMNGRYARQPFHYSIANRISYLFNFQGPSMAIDTACSSSLTAVHVALDSIYSGFTTIAIVGGVNLIIDPDHYFELTEMTMLSSGNQCRAFGERADGFIDAEGVGAIIIKPLKLAIENGDHIYGVIKGSAVNAGGKTNGYTVPNPKAQSAVIKNALKTANITADQISYIEAHGTGTSLGDPIEIAGLTRAFKEVTNENQFCAIGSVKSNIGHTESAAGISGLTKVLLQFKYGQLVPSLNADIPNPEIDFNNTPFKVQMTLDKWKRPLRNVDGMVREIPRIAGISSFGAGGANAHIIVQEFETESTKCKLENITGQTGKVIIVLSARTIDQLRKKAEDLLQFLKTNQKVDLVNMAYTLQVGRVAMDERLGFLTDSVKTLEDLIQDYLKNNPNENIYQAQTKQNKETFSLFSVDTDLNEAIDKWINKRKLNKILEFWVKGLEIDWNRFYNGSRPSRISLPGYPFARERYWKELTVANSGCNVSNPVSLIHPLIHSNTSIFGQQQYTSVFKGNESFILDKKDRNLPQSAFLEMARVAFSNAFPKSSEKDIIELYKIEWGMPFFIEPEKPIYTTLFINNNHEICFEIYSINNDEIIHCQGYAAYIDEYQNKKVDFVNLENETKQNTNQLLCKIVLPSEAQGTQTDFVLQPVLMNEVMELSLDFIAKSLLNGSQLSLNISIDSIVLVAPLASDSVVWIRHSKQYVKVNKSVQLDIDILDCNGNVCVKIKGFTIQGEEQELKMVSFYDTPENSNSYRDLAFSNQTQKSLQTEHNNSAFIISSLDNIEQLINDDYILNKPSINLSTVI